MARLDRPGGSFPEGLNPSGGEQDMAKELTFGEWIAALTNSKHAFSVQRVAGVVRVCVDAV